MTLSREERFLSRETQTENRERILYRRSEEILKIYQSSHLHIITHVKDKFNTLV